MIHYIHLYWCFNHSSMHSICTVCKQNIKMHTYIICLKWWWTCHKMSHSDGLNESHSKVKMKSCVQVVLQKECKKKLPRNLLQIRAEANPQNPQSCEWTRIFFLPLLDGGSLHLSGSFPPLIDVCTLCIVPTRLWPGCFANHPFQRQHVKSLFPPEWLILD